MTLRRAFIESTRAYRFTGLVDHRVWSWWMRIERRFMMMCPGQLLLEQPECES